nr:zinc finger, CCHC-type [Tanacetum cinerariifolium]
EQSKESSTLEKEDYTVKMQMGRIKEQEKVQLGIKVGANIMVTRVPGQEGAYGNVAKKKKVKESMEANLGKLLKFKLPPKPVPVSQTENPLYPFEIDLGITYSLLVIDILPTNEATTDRGLDVPTRQILDFKGAIPSMKAADAMKSIQEMGDHSQKWHNGTSSRCRSTKTSDGLLVI